MSTLYEDVIISIIKLCFVCVQVYSFENADGAGRASDIVIQSVARFSTLAIIPVVLCSCVLYFLVS